MSSTLHLIGGGPGAIRQMRGHLKHAVAATGKPKALVAYVGAASGDNAGFRTMLQAAFLGTGARLVPAKLASPRAKPGPAIALLEECDLVFMSGGDVDAGMKVLEDKGAAEVLRKLGRKGKPMVGVSAGSIMLGQRWVRFPDQDDESSAEPFDCLGIAPLSMDAHSEADGWSELKVLVRLLGELEVEPALGYGVPSKGCLLVDEKGTPRAHGEPIARLRFRGGRVVEEPPLT